MVMASVNIVIGLVFLVALVANRWSALLLAVLVTALILMLRSFAEFFRQHRTLTDVYELTKAVREEGADAALPDVLLGRVRALMRAEYATLWLAPQGRHPEVLLTARVENMGLLDLSPTPAAIRERAIADGQTFAVGPSSARPRTCAVSSAPPRSKTWSSCRCAPVRRPSAASRWSTGSATPVRSARPTCRCSRRSRRTRRPRWKHRLVERLRHDAYHDRLTGLPNRRRITDALAEAVKVHAEKEVVATLLFDVDGQRDVNESMGHAAGDKLLAEVAERLRGIAGPGALVGRLGGDEFVVTLRAESTDATVRLATEMREQLRGPMTVGTLTLDVDTAVGVSVYPDHGADPETLIQRAELAANAAKVLPYGVQLFHPALESRAVRRLGIAADLRKALDNDELDVYFQPKVTLADRHLVGVECLARWTHAAHGEVAPEDFVAVAEHTGQLSRLTERVLAEGLRRCRQWAEADRPLSIAVNLSVRTLLDSRFRRPGRGAARAVRGPRGPGDLRDLRTGHARRHRAGAADASTACATSGSGSASTTSARARPRCRTCASGRSTRSRSTTASCRAWRPTRATWRSCGRSSACPVSSVSRWWPRGSRASSPSTCWRRWAARSARDTSSAVPCRTSVWRPGSALRPSRNPPRRARSAASAR
jgi:diguanylate cyclase (GGDEF)-like protein